MYHRLNCTSLPIIVMKGAIWLPMHVRMVCFNKVFIVPIPGRAMPPIGGHAAVARSVL